MEKRKVIALKRIEEDERIAREKRDNVGRNQDKTKVKVVEEENEGEELFDEQSVQKMREQLKEAEMNDDDEEKRNLKIMISIFNSDEFKNEDVVGKKKLIEKKKLYHFD